MDKIITFLTDWIIVSLVVLAVLLLASGAVFIAQTIPYGVETLMFFSVTLAITLGIKFMC